jgi:F-type H+-transporting ATPase subunit b
MHIDWWTLALQTVNALVLVWLLARYLFKPVAAIVAQRQQTVAALLADAARAHAAALAAQAQAAAATQRIEQQRDQLLADAQAQAAQLQASLESAAHVEVQALRAAAQADLARAQQEAAAGDDARAAQLAVGIAAKLLERLPQEVRISGFIDGLAQALREMPAASRAELGHDGAPLTLSAPRALQDSELAACRSALAAVLGREVQLRLCIDPTMLAGLELEAPHAIVRNSFRADLADLQTGLLAHDTHHASA